MAGNGQGRGTIVKWHEELTTRLFLFDQTKTKLRAVLDIHLKRGPDPNLTHLLRSVQVRQCFNGLTPHWAEEVGTFTLDYQIKSDTSLNTVSINQDVVRDNFYAQLMLATDLLPLQLNADAHIETSKFSQGQELLHIHFSVMEAPTSYLYLRHIQLCTMEEEMETKSESRIVPTLVDCSLWCDQTNCAAMSYCRDRICRIVTARTVFGKSVRSINSSNPLKQTLNEEHLRSLSSCKMANECSYYFQHRRQPRPTLARFRQIMELMVNQERERVRDLLIELSSASVEPISFHEYGQRFLAHADDIDDPVELVYEAVTQTDNNKTISWNWRKYTFGVLERDRKLDLGWIENELPKHKEEGFVSIVANAGTIAECYDACNRLNCLILSHCKESGECLLAAARKKSFADIRPIQRKLLDAAGCSVHARNYLSSFQKFEATWPPKQWDKLIDDVPLLVCSSMCQAAGDQCLSFDFCSYAQAEKEEPRTRCMLQAAHVSLDSFDRSLMLPEWEGPQSNSTGDPAGAKRPDCDHYSKDLLADFERLPNRKLAQAGGGALRGINEQRCAAACLQDDQCGAFEFCRTDRRHPSQSCFLARQESPADSLHEAASQSGPETTSSRTCSVYVARKLAQADRLGHTLTLAPQSMGTLALTSTLWPCNFLSIVVWLLGAVSLGAVVQFAHIKLTSRALLFEQQVSL